jgi:uncharacterized membrane protein YqaE (UPF0057 family)
LPTQQLWERQALRLGWYPDGQPSPPWRRILNIVRVILAILLPPVGVFLTVGLGLHFWINILLTIFGYIPGIVHAVWIISSRAKERELR